MTPIDTQHSPAKDHDNMRAWLLMQAQLQLDYVAAENALILLELLEAVYGQSNSSGLLLCRTWASLGERKKLELRANKLLSDGQLQADQKAALYLCISTVRWQQGDPAGARRARSTYKTTHHLGNNTQ